jgi:hypothetical protein
MPWVRIDEHAMEHPKVAGLSDGAFRLWIVGLVYCQKFLTDGYISPVALAGLRGMTSKRSTELLSTGLWEPAPNSGVQIHHYLDWNSSRSSVLSSREQAHARLQKHREKRVSSDVSNTVANTHLTVGGFVNGSSLERGAGKTIAFAPQRQNSEPDAVEMRAGRFCEEVYPALYAKFRKGARYVGKPVLDYQEAVALCRTWDDERLAKIAQVFLTTDHQFAESGSRTMAQFRSLASWCDAKLIEAGIA